MTQLEELPAGIDALTSQVSQLRTEMRVEFSVVRDEIAEQGETVVATLRGEMAEEGETIVRTLRGEIAAQGETIVRTLRGEIAEEGEHLRADIDALATHMRVLHEEVIGRIAQLQEGWPRPPKPRKK